MNSTGEHIGNFIPIAELFGKSFLVKDYQRGYKWEQEEISYLLEDIDFHKSNEPYCLQPVIVNFEGDVYELIDGQQRITTLYLLWYYLTSSLPYHMDYGTREATRDFLSSKNALATLHENIISEEDVDWEYFVKDNPKFDNVDIYHIFNVYEYIHDWFTDKQFELEEDYEAFTEDFKSKLKDGVYVIWYDIVNNKKDYSSSEEVFLNLNAGKVPLTDSELIKALFILDIIKRNTPQIAELRAFQLASEWSMVENRLHDDHFWYFICNLPYYNKIDTRIDFLLDLVNGNLNGGRSTYRFYEEQFRSNDSLDWTLILQSFNKLEEWYESKDKKLFHLIGFLINSGICNMSDILEDSQNKNKKAFREALIKRIKKEFRKTKRDENNKEFKVYDKEVLNYKLYYEECKRLLLLFNVNQYINDASNNKFPFDLYNNEKWSVEHINPQNPRDFKTIKELLVHLQANQKYYEVNKSEENAEILKELEILTLKLKGIENKEQPLSRLPKDVRDALSEVEDSLTNDLNLHGIQNLVLLDRKTNSKLSNKAFLEKRREILDIYFGRGKEEDNIVFIPMTTIDVFRKSFTSRKETYKDEVFGIADMRDYEKYLFKKLKPYLS